MCWLAGGLAAAGRIPFIGQGNKLIPLTLGDRDGNEGVIPLLLTACWEFASNIHGTSFRSG